MTQRHHSERRRADMVRLTMVKYTFNVCNDKMYCYYQELKQYLFVVCKLYVMFCTIALVPSYFTKTNFKPICIPLL